MKNKTVKLYKKNKQGDVLLKEVSRGSFSDEDSFNEALDHWFGEGFTDDREEAKNNPYIPPEETPNGKKEALELTRASAKKMF